MREGRQSYGQILLLLDYLLSSTRHCYLCIIIELIYCNWPCHQFLTDTLTLLEAQTIIRSLKNSILKSMKWHNFCRQWRKRMLVFHWFLSCNLASLITMRFRQTEKSVVLSHIHWVTVTRIAMVLSTFSVLITTFSDV